MASFPRVLPVLAAFAAAALALLAGEAGAHSLRQGAGLHTMMNWATPGKESTYAWPPFDGPQHAVSDTLLANLAASGLDFIRLTVDPGPFLAFTGRQREELDRILERNVRRILAHGLDVVVDFHPNRQVARYAPIPLLEDEHGKVFDSHVEMVGRTAALLARIAPDRLAIEPLNEPAYGYNAGEVARWHRMLARLHAGVRAAAPTLPIIVSGARGGGIRGLTDLDPRGFDDANTLYSFHYYEPFDFTHQGVRSDNERMRHLRYFTNIPYPANSVVRDIVWRGIALEIDADAALNPAQRKAALARARERLDAYLDAGFDRARIEADFDKVTDWARSHDIAPSRIFLGEFGAVRGQGTHPGADPVSHSAWLRDVREAAEAHGYAWSFWSVRSHGGMTLVDRPGSDLLHEPTLRALGLTP
ncbi:MAG: cellulase family glycosylhydrolase [Rhodobiaceae bacterium]|nr:cellulase family glycosylhydrolase [Rhodobiaceae bacterium]